jgi:hypothetical protein
VVNVQTEIFWVIFSRVLFYGSASVFDIIASNSSMIDGCEKNVESSGRSLFKVQSQHLFGRTEGDHEHIEA